ncbi:hypothetical protein B0H66DRAFT_569727 [Apodospora peruviana]|uniref:Cycloeucalenol cycloisomerase n=1 Tax=Apodospora peruviana TaxID=516989 RepID=A0AAE0LZ77_9PEZI|nr:hypothetical protein B0H66DRAFT_569727 [Apodospora peruviana]
MAQPRTYKENDTTSRTYENRKEKERTQHLILAQSPLWILSVLLVMQTGILRSWSDAEYFLFSLTIASPSILIPALLLSYRTKSHGYSYWLKLNIWVFIVVCFGTYFGTHYFFDLMGMRYTFDVVEDGKCCKWHLESDILGQHRDPRQTVPLFMYLLTHAYFMPYFCILLVAEREIVKRLRFDGTVGKGLAVLFLSYSLAFAETFVMASPLLEDLFAYEDRSKMLKVGSLGYASYFVVGLPMVKRIDTKTCEGDNQNWTLARVVIEALATCMGILLLLEVWAKVVGPL